MYKDHVRYNFHLSNSPFEDKSFYLLQEKESIKSAAENNRIVLQNSLRRLW